MKALRLLLFPFALLYGTVVFIRNLLYDYGLFSSQSFRLPIIAIGNLSVGGTGKTPLMEYLIRIFQQSFTIATLSRGYGRNTKGFVLANKDSLYTDIGDEPKQFKQKFKDLIVAVDNKRVRGIKKIISQFPQVNTILLDDAFQHRAVKAGISILLTEYNKLFYNDYIMPMGNLRESKQGSNRADIIIVTKTPTIFSPLERKRILYDISLKSHQKIYFSYLEYGDFVPFNTDCGEIYSKEYYFEKKFDILLLSGIAHSSSLLHYVKEKTSKVVHVKYPDHHPYTTSNVHSLIKRFEGLVSENKIILTTEKDAMRLNVPKLNVLLKNIPLFYMPIKMAFHGNDEEDFNQQVTDYVKRNQPRE